ncbi:ATPase [Nocardioides gansuensis]|uniref:ATPase n=1 Tax=Nocardioides gansuensis TaxID=2138300 RepID=A0A2T8F8I4_9ACTN|nr:LuxR C-terminal-related transcriptional regulator [Nocardioides gansuensis]PVG82005.1 ATPase [Nocardioides gansuensis]
MTTNITTTAPGALPTELTSFVGRRHEVALARRALGESRLVTLTGVGGVGKTRLALRTAMEVRRQFGDGAWFVELASLQDPLLLPHTVSKGLHINDGSADPTADLVDWLERRHLLLVLDNCEHLVEACADLVGKLLAVCPGLRVMATSRQVLGVNGEQILPVPPLSTPGSSEPPLDDASHYDSVALLVDRARAVVPDFEVTPQNRDILIDLCRRLDGLPLAIELAAVWLRVLSPPQILDRLEDRFHLLTTGARGGILRQQALDTAVAWSFDLCSPAEQLLWERLSVFFGGFNLGAAEAVCPGDGIPRDDVLTLLAGLVDKSIVVREQSDSRTASWYRMLETIRQYGAARLAAADQLREYRMRHRDYYRSLAAQFADEFFTSKVADWLVDLRREHDNIRAALDFCLNEPGEAASALEIAAPLWNWWHTHFLQEGYRYLLRGLALATEPTSTRAYALFATANVAIHLSEFDRALAMLTEAGTLAERLGDEVMAARVRQCQGHALVHSGHPAEAIPLLEEALNDAQRLGQPREECRSLLLLSLAAGLLGDERDQQLARRTVELAEQHGAKASQAWGLWGLGLAQWRVGEYAGARASLRAGLRMFQAMENFNGGSFCVQGLSWCAAFSSPDEDAARLLGAAQAVWRSIGGNVSQEMYRQWDERSEELLRDSIGDARFESAFAEGASYDLDQAMATAFAESRGTRGPSPQGQRARPSVPGGLTRREWEIAQMLAEGLSNKEIAERLVISRRTAETHVEHILTKLGFRSRTQVSAWVTDQRTGDAS